MRQFSGTVLHARMKRIKSQTEITSFIHASNWHGFKSVRAVSNAIWQMLRKCSPLLHLGYLLSPFKSVEGEQSAVLACNAGAQNAHVGRAMNADLLGDIAYRWTFRLGFLVRDKCSEVPPRASHVFLLDSNALCFVVGILINFLTAKHFSHVVWVK